MVFFICAEAMFCYLSDDEIFSLLWKQRLDGYHGRTKTCCKLCNSQCCSKKSNALRCYLCTLTLWRTVDFIKSIWNFHKLKNIKKGDVYCVRCIEITSPPIASCERIISWIFVSFMHNTYKWLNHNHDLSAWYIRARLMLLYIFITAPFTHIFRIKHKWYV